MNLEEEFFLYNNKNNKNNFDDFDDFDNMINNFMLDRNQEIFSPYDMYLNLQKYYKKEKNIIKNDDVEFIENTRKEIKFIKCYRN